MNFNHIKAIARKEFYHIRRDPGTLLMLTIGPIFLMIIFTYTMTSDVKNVPVAIVDYADNDASHELIARLGDSETIKIKTYLEDETEADDLFKHSSVTAAIIIPEDYGEISIASIPQVKAIIDGTEPVSAEKVLDTVYSITDEHSREIAADNPLLSQLFGDQLDLPVIIETETLYNPELRNVVDIYPGLAAMMLTLPAMALAMSLAGESEKGTLEQLVATPIDKKALLVGKMIPYLIFGMIDFYVLWVLGKILYDVPFRGSMIDYSIIAFLFMMANLGVAMLIAVLIRSQQVAMIVSMLVFFVPPFFMSGLFFPMDAMPFIVQLEMIEFPATHYVAASKAIHLQGTSIVDLWFPALILLILAVELLEIAAFIFRKKVIVTFSIKKLLRMGKSS
jgi:ABC-2 type transport system permease protein